MLPNISEARNLPAEADDLLDMGEGLSSFSAQMRLAINIIFYGREALNIISFVKVANGDLAHTMCLSFFFYMDCNFFFSNHLHPTRCFLFGNLTCCIQRVTFALDYSGIFIISSPPIYNSFAALITPGEFANIRLQH